MASTVEGDQLVIPAESFTPGPKLFRNPS
jgi:hypothetical protein